MGKPRINSYQIDESLSQEEKIDGSLRLFGLEGMRSSFRFLAEEAIKNKTTPQEFLDNLLEKERVWKETNRIERWIQQANFPYRKTLDDFDFPFQPNLNEQLIRELSSCRFVDKKENIIFFGPPGVGKTHLSVGIGTEAIYQHKDVKCFRLDVLIEMIEKAEEGLALHRLSSALLRPKILILDEIDSYKMSELAGEFLFKIIQHRYENSSIIFTSNAPFSEWAKLFPKEISHKINKVLSRLVHHSTIINIDGPDYRIKDKLK